MAEYCGAENPKCLYFGDHLVQDVLAADMSRLDAVAILEELEQEDPTSDYVSVSRSLQLTSLHSDIISISVIRVQAAQQAVAVGVLSSGTKASYPVAAAGRR